MIFLNFAYIFSIWILITELSNRIMGTQTMKRFNTFLLCFLVCISAIYAQKSVTGKVVDSSGEALFGVHVLEAGTTNGTYWTYLDNIRISIDN